MNSKKSVLIIGILLLVSVCTSCVTNTRVHIDSDVEGASVYVDGEYVGETPCEVKVSNAAWKDTDVVLKKDGYRILKTSCVKEIKVINLAFGVTIWWPSLIWCYGPRKNQLFFMYPETAN